MESSALELSTLNALMTATTNYSTFVLTALSSGLPTDLTCELFRYSTEQFKSVFVVNNFHPTPTPPIFTSHVPLIPISTSLNIRDVDCLHTNWDCYHSFSVLSLSFRPRYPPRDVFRSVEKACASIAISAISISKMLRFEIIPSTYRGHYASFITNNDCR